MPIVNSNSHSWHMDGYLVSNIDALKKGLRKDFDAFLIVDGRERFGKTSLAAQIAYYVDPTYNLDRCVFTAEQFIEAVDNAEPYQAIVFDEAHGYLNSRQALSRFNRALIKVMSEMGRKNLFIIICIPSFFELDKYPAIHRSNGLVHVYQRGKFGAYDYKAKKALYIMGKKFYSYAKPSPNFIGRYTKFFPLDWDEYNKKKNDSTIKIELDPRETKWKQQRDILIKELYNHCNYSQEKVSELVGLNASTLSLIISGKR